MEIEVLDGIGAVITRVSGSDDPDRDRVAYGGESWRDYVTPADVRIERKRSVLNRAIREHALSLIRPLSPSLANLDTLALVLDLHAAGAFQPTFPLPGSDMARIRQIYLYARNRIADANTADEAGLDSYDPTTDNGWP